MQSPISEISPDCRVLYGGRLGELDDAGGVQPHDVHLEAMVEGVAQVLLLQDRDRLGRRLRHVRAVCREAPGAVAVLVLVVLAGAVDLE